MTTPEGIEWRRSFPSGPLSALLWYIAFGGFFVAIAWMLFGAEPEQLDDGTRNPLAGLASLITWAALVGLAVCVHNVFRRPRVAANHFALTLRPGSRRTLVLPWARVHEIAIRDIDNDRYLLVRCRTPSDTTGHLPHWCDRGILRKLDRDSDVASRYDLAVRMADFIGDPDGRVTALVAFAPDHVTIAADEPHLR